MARVIGLDIGTLSVKAVAIEAGLRTWELIAVDEEPIVRHVARATAEADDDASSDEESTAPVPVADAEDDADALEALEWSYGEATLNAIRALHGRGALDGDSLFAILPADHALITRVNLPFASEREIAPVLAPQLEGRLPADVEDLLIDFMRGARLESGEYVVYAAGIEPAKLALLLAEMETTGADPRALDIAPFHLVTAGRALITTPHQAPVAIVDIGAETTGVVVFDATDVQYARTFQGGGERVTAALADVFSLDAETARAGKHREGFIDAGVTETAAPTGDDAVDVANACRAASKPLVRQLRRTLHAHATEWGEGVEAVYLCGGGAALPGLADYIAQSLGVPVMPLPTAVPAAEGVENFGEEGGRYVTALALALRGASGLRGSTMDARVGAFAFKGTYEYIRARVPQIAFGLATLLVLGVACIFGRIALANAESAALETALAGATSAVFGEEVTDPDEIASRFRLGTIRPSFMPTVTAYEVFLDATETVNATLNLGYDVAAEGIEVDLERRIFRITGTCDSAESVDTFEAQLAESECFREIERTELEQARNGDRFEFSVQANIECGAPATEDDE